MHNCLRGADGDDKMSTSIRLPPAVASSGHDCGNLLEQNRMLFPRDSVNGHLWPSWTIYPAVIHRLPNLDGCRQQAMIHIAIKMTQQRGGFLRLQAGHGREKPIAPPIRYPGHDKVIGWRRCSDDSAVGYFRLDDVRGQRPHADLIATIANPDGGPAPLPGQIVKKEMQRSGLTGHIPSMFTMGFTIGRRRDALDSNEMSDRSISTFKRFPQTVYRSLVRCRHLEVNLFRNGVDHGPYRLCAGSVGDNRNRYARACEPGSEMPHSYQTIRLRRRRGCMLNKKAGYDTGVGVGRVQDRLRRLLKIPLHQLRHSSDVAIDPAPNDSLDPTDFLIHLDSIALLELFRDQSERVLTKWR